MVCYHALACLMTNVVLLNHHVLECSLHDASRSAFNISHLTQTKESDYTGDETTMISEGSSISCFPTFNFSLNAVSALSSILQIQKPMSLKVTLLLGVLEIDGLSYVKVKTGPYAGSEVALLKLVVGDENGAICRMISWRETAELWGGLEIDSGLKRGDIILFESTIHTPLVFPTSLMMTDVMVTGSLARQGVLDKTCAKLQLTASPNLKSQGQICYRTLPDTYEDQKLRPDLRLADSVPAVRKVREVVTWMERMAGIAAQP